MVLRVMSLLALCGCVFAQGIMGRVRVSSGVTNALADHKVLPDISDLKGQKLDSLVRVAVVFSKTGDVIHVRALEGNPDLFRRSEEAAQKWHFKPYLLNGEPVEVDTTISFRFKRNKVALFAP